MKLEESKVLLFELNSNKVSTKLKSFTRFSNFFFEMHLYMTKNWVKKQNDSELKDKHPKTNSSGKHTFYIIFCVSLSP